MVLTRIELEVELDGKETEEVGIPYVLCNLRIMFKADGVNQRL